MIKVNQGVISWKFWKKISLRNDLFQINLSYTMVLNFWAAGSHLVTSWELTKNAFDSFPSPLMYDTVNSDALELTT